MGIKKSILPILFAITISLGFSYQDAFAVNTSITNQATCENAPVLGTFDSGTCVLDGTHTIPLADFWQFQIPIKVTGTVDVFGFMAVTASFNNFGTINVIGDPGGQSLGVLQFVFSTDYTNECNGIINLIGGTSNGSGLLFISGSQGFAPVFNNFGTITGTNSIQGNSIAVISINVNNAVPVFNNHGTLTAPVNNNGGVFNDNLPDQCVPVGGISIPIDTTALLLAGLQSSAIWMLPILVGATGVGAYYIKTRMNKDN